MQLVRPEKAKSDQKMEPSIYAALIDSLCQNFWPMFAGALCAAVAAVMTALKTGNSCCGRASVDRRHRRAARALQMRSTTGCTNCH